MYKIMHFTSSPSYLLLLSMQLLHLFVLSLHPSSQQPHSPINSLRNQSILVLFPLLSPHIPFLTKLLSTPLHSSPLLSTPLHSSPLLFSLITLALSDSANDLESDSETTRRTEKRLGVRRNDSENYEASLL